MDFRLLGPLEVDDGETPVALGGAKQRAVLAHLLLRANSVVPADRLIDEVWEDDPPPAARNVLQTYVSRLRKALGGERLTSRAGGYVLHAAPEEIDVNRFRALVDEARRRAAVDPASAIELYREADGIWRGPALDDLAEQPSLRGEIGHLEELRAAARDDRIVAELSLGRHADLVPELESLTSLHPLREGLWARLMTALYRSGRQADALAAYRRARAVLVEELGIEPSSELRELEQRILQQDPELETAARPLRGFRVLEKIGEGSFGVVHRAVQPHVDRDVAVKVIRPALANDPEFIRRFEAEAQLIARLEHPHVVPLYDYWREPDGAFLVMRYLRGGSLRDALVDGPLPLLSALHVAEQVGGALASAHRQGIVHRDVKPANILFDEERNAYLSDFGIARDSAVARGPDRVIAGESSAYYMSPEESRGGDPSARGDVYSLGLVIREMVGGDLPPELEPVVRRAMADDPGARYADAAALVSALPGTVDPAPVPAGPVRNPYKGLRPFDEADAPDFLGREWLIRRLLDRLAGERLIAIVGASGSGKSSVVGAGVVPSVRAAGSYIAEMTPGSDPFEEMANALVALAPVAPPPDLARRMEADPEALAQAVAGLLPDEDSELLLVVDQFEELFTLTADDQRQAAFMAALRWAVSDPRSRVRIVMTLRADYLDRPLSHAGFAEVLRAGTELILPMGAGELERAISGPAKSVGVTAEPGLLAELVADTVGRPGALPLLQFTLAELFDRRGDGPLSLAAYRELGGVAGAVAAGAEELYAALDPPGQEAARQLFLRLVQGGSARRGELASLSEETERVIDAFAARRLLSFDRDPDTREPTVQLAHDALLEAWGRLREWLAEAHEELQLQRRLASAAREWNDAGRDPSFLLRGSRLEVLEHPALALTAVEQEFLRASAAERDRMRAQERRSLRRLRTLAGVLAVAAVVAVAFMVFAFDQRSEAEQERRVAEARGLVSAAVADLGVDPDRSILLALEAVRRSRPVLPEAEEALHRAVVSSRVVLRVPGIGGALDWSPEGSLFATEGPEDSGKVDIRDAATGESVHTFKGHDADVNLVAFSPDGGLLATSSDDGVVRLWDTRTGERRRSFDGLPPSVWGISFSADGSLLAASSMADSRVRIWAVDSGRLVSQAEVPAAGLTTSFSPDGKRIAVATFDAGGVVLDVASGRQVMTLRGQEGVSDVDWSPDGRWIATSSFDGPVHVWDGRSGRSRFALSGHKSEVVAADWSSDSRRLATGSSDGTAKVWEIGGDGTREALSIAAQERGGGLWVAFSPDGDRLMTGDQGITSAKVWDVSRRGGREWANLPGVEGGRGGVAFSADGKLVAAARGDGSIALWEPETGRRVRTVAAGPEPAIALDMSRDGRLAATTAFGTARTWEPSGGREGFEVTAEEGNEDVAWSPDGKLLAAAGNDGVLRVADRTGRLVAVLTQKEAGYRLTGVSFSGDGRLIAASRVSIERPSAESDDVAVWDWKREQVVQRLDTAAVAVAFSPDGTRIATAALFGPVQIWDAHSGRSVRRLAGHTGVVHDVTFSPDGSRVATASADATVRLWDPESGRKTLILRGHDGIVWDVDFSPDSTKLVSSGRDGLRVWALELDNLVAIARRRVTRALTPEECRQHLPGREC